MAKVRIYQLAKKYNMHYKDLIKELNKYGFSFKSHMQTVEEDVVLNIFEKKDKKKQEEKGKTKVIKKDFQSIEKKKQKVIEREEKVEKTLENKDVKGKKVSDKKKDINRVEDINVLKKKYNKLNVKKGKKRKYKKLKKQQVEIEKTQKDDDLLDKYIQVPKNISVMNLAEKMNMPLNKLILKLMSLGYMLAANDLVTKEVINKLQDESDFVFDFIEDNDTIERIECKDSEEVDYPERPPVITIMGHVDHGKTSLLDVIRESNIAKMEAGGITQKIGAYQVEYENKDLTFIDTPGHEAFTSMRARGAQVTDIAILVVAADDGVMPQTIEAINHAKAAKVPIIVAINKIDKPNANVDRVKQQLTEFDLIPEEWGGDTVFVEISAKKRIGIDNLLEYILLVAEMQELKAPVDTKAKGIIIESRIDRGKGAVATVLVKEGTLKVGDAVVAGCVYGKVRAMINDKGKRIKKALPSTPVELLGLSSFVQAGTILEVVSSEKEAKSIALNRSREKDKSIKMRKMTLTEISKDIKEGALNVLKLIVKADSDGSIQALSHSLSNIVSNNKNVSLELIHTGIGNISESDVMLASASKAIILGFNVKISQSIRKLSEKENVEIRLYNIIYELIEDITKAISGMEKPVFEEINIGKAEVRAVFNISKEGKIAGCYIKEGRVLRNCKVEVIRDKNVLIKTKVNSLKRFKNDVSEVVSGYECGIGLKDFPKVEVGDTLLFYIDKEVEK